MNRYVFALAAFLALDLMAALAATASRTQQIVGAADAFLATLDERQRQDVQYRFDDQEQRQSWTSLASGFEPHGGIALKDMTANQRDAAMQLLSAALSKRGYEKVLLIMQGDEVLREMEGLAPQGPPPGMIAGMDRGGPPPDQAGGPGNGRMGGPSGGGGGRGGFGGRRGGGGGSGGNGPQSMSQTTTNALGGPPPGGGDNGPTSDSSSGYGPSIADMGAPPMRRGGPPAGQAFGRDLYRIALLGAPSDKTPWTLQFGGHHLALNITFSGERSVLSPALIGTQPVMFSQNGLSVRPLEGESDKAGALLEALDPQQREKANQPMGIKASAMKPGQRAMLLDLIGEWGGMIHDSAATARMAEIKAGLDETSIAWNGPNYRILGPKLAIDFTQQRSGSEQIDTIYR